MPLSSPKAQLARFADEAWRPPLLGGAPLVGARVETAFERSLNVSFERGLLTILTDSGRRAPGAMITTLPDVRGVHPETPVEFNDSTLVIGRLELDCSRLTFFDCVARPIELTTAPSATELDAILALHSRPGSFLPRETETPFERAITARLDAARDAFCTQLRLAASAVAQQKQRINTEAMRHTVATLVGLGFGLTPSGDDYLVGVLAALTLTPGAMAQQVRDLVSACVFPLASQRGDQAATTAVSQHFLRAACRGEFHEDLASAGREILLGEDRTNGAVARAVSIGSTSGTDALFGLVDGIRVIGSLR